MQETQLDGKQQPQWCCFKVCAAVVKEGAGRLSRGSGLEDFFFEMPGALRGHAGQWSFSRLRRNGHEGGSHELIFVLEL